jgi:polyisoprenoid-binding protein YceI
MATWNLDKTHTSIEFVATHMMFTKVRGKFEDFSGVIHYDPANPNASSVEVTIQAASINSGVADRDNHLKSPDFLDVANHPTLTFKSTKVEANGDKAKIYGDLTIRDVTRPVVIDAEAVGEGVNPWGMKVAGFSGSTKINREDFGLTWNVMLEAGGVLVSKEITINLDVQAVLAANTEAEAAAV